MNNYLIVYNKRDIVYNIDNHAPISKYENS